jgi:N-acetylneuraminic acid mutarotase
MKSILKLFYLFIYVTLFISFLSKSLLAQATDDTLWTTKTPMPTPRFWFGCEVVDNKIYAIGGAQESGLPTFSVVEVYDPKTDTWDTTKAHMPTRRCVFSTAVVDGKIYTFGGDSHFVIGEVDPLRTVEVYDPATDTWDTTKTKMPTARAAAAACVVNDTIYIIGGVTIDTTTGFPMFPNVVEAYDPLTNEWTTKAPMPNARHALSACTVNGKIYAMGGGSEGYVFVEEYDPSTDTWDTTKTEMPIGLGYFGSCVVDNMIYIIGGGTGLIHTSDSSFFSYNPITDTWKSHPSMPTARMGLCARAVNGKIYAIGGAPGWPPVPLSTVEAVDLVLSIKNNAANAPISYTLHQNYPNPFNPSTTIKFQIPSSKFTTLLVYNILGKEVATLVSKRLNPGNHTYTFDGNNLASGVYYYQLVAGDFREVKKMILLR